MSTRAQFMEAIATTLSAKTGDTLLDNFNLKMLNVLDDVAQVKVKKTESTMEKHHDGKSQ